MSDRDLVHQLLNANEEEYRGIVTLWNSIAPGMKHRINCHHPERLSPKNANRLDVLLNTTRHCRLSAALFCAQRCLDAVNEAASLAEAAKSIAGYIEDAGGQADGSAGTEEHELVKNQ